MDKNEIKFLEQLEKSDIFNENIIKLQNDIDIFAGVKKVIAVTSVDNNFLSGVCIKHLAKKYAENNQKTLVIDANLNTPLLQELYETEIIESNDKILKINDYLDVMPATKEIYSAKKLMSDEFVGLIDDAKNSYDRILILVSPVVTNKEILVFKDIIETSILITKKDDTLMKNVHSSVEFIKKHQIPFAGAVLLK